MRKALAVIIFFSLAAGVFAESKAESKAERTALNAEITAILDQNAQTPIGQMTVADAEKIAGQISVAIQKDEYIRAAGRASFMIPGAGQFKTGDTSGGALFLAGDVALMAGTFLGAYLLLPSNVQFGSLDYLNTPISSIRSTWESNTAWGYAPAFAVAAVGMAAQMVLRWFSARDAENGARTAIASGRVNFEPRLVPLFGPMGTEGRMGMGFSMRMP